MKRPSSDSRVSPAGRLSLASAALLIALAVAPTWSNPASSFGFEPDKTWLLILLMAFGLGARLASQSGPRFGRPGRIDWTSLAGWARRDLLRLAPAPILGAALISTLCAVGPTWAWYGSPQRADGLFSLAALAVAFWLAWDALRQPGGPAALAESIALSSLPVLLVALWQSAGWLLPAPWSGDGFAGRLFATLGNPGFLSSYLTLALPLTLASAAMSWRPAAWGRAISLGVLALGQIAALYGTRSRAGWLGALGALLLLALIVALRRHWRLAAGVAAVALLGIFVGVAPLMLETNADEPGQGAEWGLALDPTGSGRQRLAFWDSTLRYLSGGNVSVGRWLVGFGPDTAGLILPNQVAYRVQANGDRGEPAHAFDRAHTIILDGLLTQGVLGLAAWLALGGAVGAAGLRRAGWRAPKREVGIALAAGVAGSVGATFLAAALLGDVKMGVAALPVAVGMGLAAGWCGLLVWRGWRGAPAAGAPAFLSIAALAGLFGHWIEMQFSFSTPATNLLAWVCLALLWGAPAEASATPTARLDAGGRRVALLCGAVLSAVVLAAELSGPTVPAALLAALWIGGAGLTAAWGGRVALEMYPTMSLGPALLLWLAMRLIPANEPRTFLATWLAWAALGLCAGALAWAERRSVRPGWLSALVVLAGLVIVTRLSAGDMLMRDGLRLARSVDLAGAEVRLSTALMWGIHDGLSRDALSQVYLARSNVALQLTQRYFWLGRAADAAGAAWAAVPQQTEFGRRQALIYEVWAEAMPERAGRLDRLSRARDILERAAVLAPADPRPRADLAHINQLLAESK